MPSLSGGEKNRVEEEERITGAREKRERCWDQSVTEQIISGLVSCRKPPWVYVHVCAWVPPSPCESVLWHVSHCGCGAVKQVRYKTKLPRGYPQDLNNTGWSRVGGQRREAHQWHHEEVEQSKVRPQSGTENKWAQETLQIELKLVLNTDKKLIAASGCRMPLQGSKAKKDTYVTQKKGNHSAGTRQALL